MTSFNPDDLLAIEHVENATIAAAGTRNMATADIPDVSEFEHMVLLAASGPITGTSVTVDISLQESDSQSSGFADITGHSGSTYRFTDTGDARLILAKLRLHGRKKYIRAQIITAGTTPSAQITVLFALIKKQYTTGLLSAPFVTAYGATLVAPKGTT